MGQVSGLCPGSPAAPVTHRPVRALKASVHLRGPGRKAPKLGGDVGTRVKALQPAQGLIKARRLAGEPTQATGTGHLPARLGEGVARAGRGQVRKRWAGSGSQARALKGAYRSQGAGR